MKLTHPTDKLLKDLDKFIVGFDSWGSLPKQGNYPPHNTIKIDEGIYLIEIAVAGFSKDELEIERKGNILEVRGNSTKDEDLDYMVKGISNRDFVKTFRLDDNMEVDSANYENGLLGIGIITLIPEKEKPKLISIS